MARLISPIIIPLEKSYPVLRIADQPAKISWRKLAIVTTEQIRFVAFEEIVYCMSNSNYTTVFLRSGKSYLCTRTLKEIESRLPSEMFLRIHDSYLVNLECITSLKKKTGELEIENRMWLPVSRAKKAIIYSILNL